MFQIFFTVISILLIVVVLIQQKSSSLGSMMGGGDSGGEEMAQTRRGADKFLFRATLALSVIFAGAGIYAMVF